MDRAPRAYLRVGLGSKIVEKGRCIGRSGKARVGVDYEAVGAKEDVGPG